MIIEVTAATAKHEHISSKGRVKGTASVLDAKCQHEVVVGCVGSDL